MKLYVVAKDRKDAQNIVRDGKLEYIYSFKGKRFAVMFAERLNACAGWNKFSVYDVTPEEKP